MARQWKELGRFGLSTGNTWALEDEERRYAVLDPLGGRWTVKLCTGHPGVAEWLSSSPPLSLDAAKAWAEEALRRLEEGEHPRVIALDLTDRASGEGESPALIAADFELQASLALCQRWQEALLPLFRDNGNLKLHVFEHPAGFGLVVRWFGSSHDGDMFVSVPTKEPNEAELEMVRASLLRVGIGRSKHEGEG